MLILHAHDAGVTWERLISLEPRLDTARTMPELRRLVGWTASTKNSVLRSSIAWHIAIGEIIQPPRQASSSRRCA